MFAFESRRLNRGTNVYFFTLMCMYVCVYVFMYVCMYVCMFFFFFLYNWYGRNRRVEPASLVYIISHHQWLDRTHTASIPVCTPHLKAFHSLTYLTTRIELNARTFPACW